MTAARVYAAGAGLAGLLGAAALVWVVGGGVGQHPLALAMTLGIAAVYVAGLAELWRFHRDTAALADAVAQLRADTALLAWLDGLPTALRQPVRRRIAGAAAALPGPVLTAYLVGLLVLLGMLGTFLGLVVTLNGTVAALEHTTELTALRAALALPVKGLGLAFGTSVAGVAASAMLGLASALLRRVRGDVQQNLDRASALLQAATPAAQRAREVEALARELTGQLAARLEAATQTQTSALPALVGQVQALIDRLDAQQLARQQQEHAQQLAFQHTMLAQFDTLATRLADTLDTTLGTTVAQALRDSLADGAEAARSALQAAAAAAVDGIARESTAVQSRLSDGIRAQMQALHAHTSAQVQALVQGTQVELNQLTQRLSQGLEATAERIGQALQQQATAAAEAAQARQAAWSETLAQRTEALQAQSATQARDIVAELARVAASAAEAPRAAAAVMTQMGEQLSASQSRDAARLNDHARLTEALSTLVDDSRRAAAEQQAAVQALVDAADQLLQRSGQAVAQHWQAALTQQGEAATRLAGGAVEVASLGEAFGAAVAQFGGTAEALASQLQGVAEALDQAATRHDEQLAYYVAQAREVIDLSLSAQQPLLETMPPLLAALQRIAGSAMAVAAPARAETP